MFFTKIIIPNWQNLNQSDYFDEKHSKIANKGHSVLEQIWIKGSYLDQRLPQYESLYPIGLNLARIEIPHGGSHYIDFSKTDFY